MAEQPEHRWGVVQRFEFIEWRLSWVGKVNRKDLEDKFQISTPQASVDLRNYREAAPDNIQYDETEKAYLPTQTFRPAFLKLSPERYLLQLYAIKTGAISIEDTLFEKLPPSDVAPSIIRSPQAETLKTVLRAIESRKAIEIDYQSLTRAGIRRVCPHALGHDGYRWHVRAWSADSEEFRDYVLGRILSISGPITFETDVTADDDLEWTTMFPLKLIAHPGLKEHEKAAIEHDYRLVDGVLEVPVRVALAYYFVKRHNLDLRKKEIEPARAQLYLENFDELQIELKVVKERSKAAIAARRALNRVTPESQPDASAQADSSGSATTSSS